MGPYIEIGAPPDLPPAHYMERFTHSLIHSTTLYRICNEGLHLNVMTYCIDLEDITS
jgi:hypothetical protein